MLEGTQVYGPAPSHSTCELPVVPRGPELVVPDPTDSGYLRQSFSSLVVPVFFQGLPGGGSVWRAAQMIRDSRQAPRLAQVVESKVVGIAGRVSVGPIRPRECP